MIDAESIIDIALPYNFEPRDYQVPFLEALDAGYKRFVIIMPRRSGKTKMILNGISMLMTERMGSYYHFFPEYKQARRAIWEGRDGAEFRFLDHFPRELRHHVNNQEMVLTMKDFTSPREPGSQYHLIGADNPDRAVGTNPIACVFDEWPLMNPSIWNYMRPILAENGGIAIFAYTPRGDNHGQTTYQMALDDPEHWFVMKLTVEDTKHISAEVLEQERLEIIRETGDDALFYQEYYTSFDAPMSGSVYGKWFRDITEMNPSHVTDLPYDPALPVDTSWDLGYGDDTVIWFVQRDPMGYYRFIDYYSATHHDITDYALVLQQKAMEHRYVYGTHYVPHDIKIKNIQNGGITLITQLQQKMPTAKFEVVPRIPLVMQRVMMVRNTFPRLWFDRKKCLDGINSVKSYRFLWDKKRGRFQDEPYDDWAAHASDALGQIIQANEKPVSTVKQGAGGIRRHNWDPYAT